MARPQVYWPRPVQVSASEGGTPLAIDGITVEMVREQWLVEDRWWTPKPLQRRYFEVVLTDGRDVVVFREPDVADEGAEGDRAFVAHWFEQRA
jgi:hypothetical protein